MKSEPSASFAKPEPNAPLSVAHSVTKASGRITIAIVEDDHRTRAILSKWINESANFRCRGTYCDAENALKHIPIERPDIVLMDINLPHINGVECVRLLKEQSPSMQFVMLTVYEDVEHIFAAISAGAVGYLLKRSSPEELIGALNYVCSGGSPMTTVIARKVAQSFQGDRMPPTTEDNLSARERQVLELVARGFFYKEIAIEMGVTLNTVHTFIRRIYEKLQVRTRCEAMAKYKSKR